MGSILVKPCKSKEYRAPGSKAGRYRTKEDILFGPIFALSCPNVGVLAVTAAVHPPEDKNYPLLSYHRHRICPLSAAYPLLSDQRHRICPIFALVCPLVGVRAVTAAVHPPADNLAPNFFRKNPPCHNLSLKFCIPALYIQTNPVDRDLRLSHGISQLRT